jgi:anaerobic magnesium-protoporphyrin IX monomethyl ester cyclase
VGEMRLLHDERDIRIFLFQDDDFPLFGTVWRRWANEFVDELHRSGLPEKVIWKMNCRADAVDRELFIRMRDAGLYLVYMGLESGSEQGLETLHKQITVEQNLRAVEILKSIVLMFEYGFMLLDPSSTFESVRDNLKFLRTIPNIATKPSRTYEFILNRRAIIRQHAAEDNGRQPSSRIPIMISSIRGSPGSMRSSRM